MPEEKQETACQDYTIEREFLARISTAELISHIIQSHRLPVLSREEDDV